MNLAKLVQILIYYTTCIDNYFLFSGKCYSCNNNCKTTNDDNCLCESCEDDYNMHNFQCFKCDSNCKTCSGASTNCTSCVNRKYLTFNRTCEKCIETCINC